MPLLGNKARGVACRLPRLQQVVIFLTICLCLPFFYVTQSIWLFTSAKSEKFSLITNAAEMANFPKAKWESVCRQICCETRRMVEGEKTTPPKLSTVTEKNLKTVASRQIIESDELYSCSKEKENLLPLLRECELLPLCYWTPEIPTPELVFSSEMSLSAHLACLIGA